MKIYHTETQEDYDALMVELEEQGIEILEKEYWKNNRHETVVFVHAIGPYGDSSRTDTTYGSLGWAFKNHPSVPITKYKAKVDEKMKIYHTETQRDFDALMIELEAVGCEWFSGRKPTEATTYWKLNSIETCVKIDKKVIAYNEKGYYAMRYPSTPITKYKAKADEKMKFTKENVEAVINSYYDTFVGGCPSELIADVYAMYEADDITEQRYTVVIGDRYLTKLFIGRADFRFIEFGELSAWKAKAYQLTEAEIKEIDERYWAFAVPVQEVK